jgi:hypothetical protein
MDVRLAVYVGLALSAAAVYYYAGKYGRRLWDHFTSANGRRQ